MLKKNVLTSIHHHQYSDSICLTFFLYYVVTITEYEETTNDLGILTLAHIKGSIGGSGNQLFSNYFTSPTTDPGELFYNITANFEYNISED